MKNYYLATALCVTLIGCSSTPQNTQIQPDPAWTSGQLDNGLTYHVYPDHEASVSVRLLVHAGSFQENEQQKGYAHFVEHMAFNGSKNFSQNDVISLFEHAGASFGADLNAYTSYQQTVYQLDLPDNTQLKPALTWLRDIGDGLEIASREVEKEKGVILGEFRYSRLEDKQVADKFYDHFIEGGPYEFKDALGTKESVTQANSQGLKSFYQTWYQPQLVEVIVSGDININDVVPLIEKQFSDWERGQSPKPAKQKITTFNEGDFIEYVGSSEPPSISLMTKRAPSVIENHAQQHQLWLDEFSQQMIQQRPNKAFNDAALPTQWVISQNYLMEYQRYSLTSVAFPAGEREVTQQKLLSTLASLRDYGVSENEIVSEVQVYKGLLYNVEKDWDQMDSVIHADYKTTALEVEQKVQSQRDYQASLEAFLENLDLDVINDNIEALLSSDYFLVVGVDKSEDQAEIVSSIDSLKAEYSKPGIQPLFAMTSSAFAIPSAQGDIVTKEQMYTDPHIQKWMLSNGIEMWYLRDSLAGEQVGLYYISLGGKEALDPSLYPAVEVTLPAIARSGVGSFTGSELEAHMDRESIQVYPFIDSTRHGIEFKLNKDGLAETFAALNAIVTSPNVSPDQLEAVKQEFIEARESFLESPVGQFDQAMNQNSFAPNSRHFLLDGKSVESVSADDVFSVYQQLFGQFRNNKIVVVGNIDPSELMPLVRQYAASIPLEKAAVPDFKVAYNTKLKERIDMAINNEDSTEYILRVISEKSSEAVSETELPSSGHTEKQSAKEVFMEDLLQRILTIRLDGYIREELSLDYSPYAYSISQDGEPSYDWFVGALIAPENADKIEVAIDKVITDLLKGISDDEIRSAGKQLENDFTPLEISPVDQAWVVSRYLIHGYGVEALFDVNKMVNSISSQEMNELAERIFGENSRQVKSILRPKS